MCKELCEGDEATYCQDCGRMICFDQKCADDISAPAFVTSSGDLYCDRCGSRQERSDEEAHEGDPWDMYDPYDPIQDDDDLSCLLENDSIGG